MKGDFVRSKSELIIADKLFDKGISYEYEQEFIRDDKKIWYAEHGNNRNAKKGRC